jgi:hypothetical protein
MGRHHIINVEGDHVRDGHVEEPDPAIGIAR